MFDSGERGGWFYLLMEYVDGANLRDLMTSTRIEPKQALEIVGQVCAALQYSHEQGVVHRDIKPENVLIDRAGRVKLADFGLARLLSGERGALALTGSHQVMGTPHYMAPEQWEKPHAVDHRADIYALGVVFYELLTGEMPLGRFDAPSKRVQVDVRLDEVVLKALEKEPSRRYQHASEVKDDIEAIEREPAAAARGRGDAFGALLVAQTSWKALGLHALHSLGWFLLIAAFTIQQQARTYHRPGDAEFGSWIAVAVAVGLIGLVTSIATYTALKRAGLVSSELRRSWHAYDVWVGLSGVTAALMLLYANFAEQDTPWTEFCWIAGGMAAAAATLYLAGRAIEVARHSRGARSDAAGAAVDPATRTSPRPRSPSS